MKSQYRIYYSVILASLCFIQTVDAQDAYAKTSLALSGIEAPDYAVQHWEQEYEELKHEIENRTNEGASHILNKHALIWDTDKNPLDVVLRRLTEFPK